MPCCPGTLSPEASESSVARPTRSVKKGGSADLPGYRRSARLPFICLQSPKDGTDWKGSS